ncbi:MAG: 16S rRNA (cytosine(967)-C(5))-methyltransferase RsmB [Actinobacteria bacterium]|nr:16S rRNA (cytosine(967)-C(5))-methyltransferase RsmB [Actinomycetota bacterium]MBU1943897.1 16S rRNA (cytosine(967)-C(5))-methyltransferase RsmB [Actinomycetota bacterium]MBU2688581.1 16S rRNA (cytosine(967)-C(5))-methyltransferase RsmB [Actinomycetota bacterium]
MKAGEPSRRTALEAILEYHSRGTYIDAALAAVLRDTGLDRRDRAFVTELTLGTVRMKGYLDWAIAHFSDREPSSIDDPLLWVLRLSAYQVLLMDVPDHAACDTGVSLAASIAGRGAGSYANAVLRALVRGREGLVLPDRDAEPLRYLEVHYSMPPWICGLFADEHGLDRAESLLAASNVQPPVTLRCNLMRTTREEMLERLEASGALAEPAPLVPEGILVRKGGSPALLPGYDEGLFAVQDQGSMMVGRLVAPEPGMRILDLCAAPGGKANHMAELMEGRGEVLALDCDPIRCEMVAETAARLGNTIVRTEVMDALEVDPERLGTFDRVLLDAPCSGLGTMARRADLRWRKERSDVARLAAIQSDLLDAASRMVADGGVLVYSTCTISRAENENVASCKRVRHYCTNGEEFTYVMPDTDRCDGMFIARFARS